MNANDFVDFFSESISILFLCSSQTIYLLTTDQFTVETLSIVEKEEGRRCAVVLKRRPWCCVIVGFFVGLRQSNSLLSYCFSVDREQNRYSTASIDFFHGIWNSLSFYVGLVPFCLYKQQDFKLSDSFSVRGSVSVFLNDLRAHRVIERPKTLQYSS